MALAIGELQVQTEAPAAAPAVATTAAKAEPPKLDFPAEMEKLRERELRLQAD